MKKKHIAVWQSGEPLQIDTDAHNPMRGINLSEYLIKKNFKVTLISSNFDHTNKRFRFKKVRKFKKIKLNKNLNLVLINSPGYKKNISLSRLIDHFFLAINLKFFLNDDNKKIDFAIIGFPPIEASVVFSNWLRFNKIPHIFDIKDLWPEYFFERIKNKFLSSIIKLIFLIHDYYLKKALKNCSGITTNNSFFLKYILKKIKRNKSKNDRVIYLTKEYINYKSLLPLKKKNFKKKSFNIYFCGRLNLDVFDFETVLKSLSILKQKKINFHFYIGGYGEITYNDPDSGVSEIDVQRFVMLFAYKFDDRVSFITEIEFEHVKEVYVEQAFLNYGVSDNFNLRGGLMLVPMGIVNEYHEPTTYNGVERPSLNNKLVPTTWREMGLGIYGRINSASIRYQAYVMNGFISYNDGAYKLKGTNGLRSGRQKGAESVGSNANFAARVDYYGLPGLKLGLSLYNGKTQTTDKSVVGSQVGLSMLGFDARYVKNRFSARSEYINASLSDTDKYNLASGKDLGSKMSGYYIEGAYNLLSLTARQKLDVFVRYEDFDTHAEVAGNLTKNESFHRKETTFGFSYHLADGAVFKMDWQSKGTAVPDSESKGQFNMGIGVFF